MVAVVREAAESRRGRRLRRRCCAAKLPLGPWCVLRAVLEAVPGWVSCSEGHSRLLAAGTKEEEKGEEDVAVLGREGGSGGAKEPRPGRADLQAPVRRVLAPCLLRTFSGTPSPTFFFD